MNSDTLSPVGRRITFERYLFLSYVLNLPLKRLSFKLAF